MYLLSTDLTEQSQIRAGYLALPGHHKTVSLPNFLSFLVSFVETMLDILIHCLHYSSA